MGIHSQQTEKAKGIRLAGYKINQQLDHVELIPSPWNKTWPKLASRFQSLGVLKGVLTQARGAKMIVALEPDAIVAMISKRHRKRQLPKIFAFGMLVPVLVLASLIPLKKGSTERIPAQVVKSVSQPCSLDIIGRWLQGAGESDYVKMLGTSVLGGVTAGTLECKGTRYSYTLGSEEPKRVLKLQKLDS